MSGAIFAIDASACDSLIQAMKAYEGDTEATINDVLHNYAPGVIQPEIKNLMPVSGKHWKGKKPAAKSSESLRKTDGNLSVTIRSAKSYQYLYFPDDGTNTRRHVGNQQFFLRGGMEAQDEIVTRCIDKLIEKF